MNRIIEKIGSWFGLYAIEKHNTLVDMYNKEKAKAEHFRKLMYRYKKECSNARVDKR